MFFPVSAWFPAFVLTITIEAPVIWLFLRPHEPSIIRLASLVAFANLATHPVVWFVLTQLLLVGTPEYVVSAESWAVGAEALFYWTTLRGCSARRAFGAALAANAASFVAGRLVGVLWPGFPQ